MSANAPFVFQVNKNDLGVLFIDLLKLEWSKECAFAELLDSYNAGSGKITDDLKEIAENETCVLSLQVLANPLHRTAYNTGGSMLPVSFMNVYSNNKIDQFGLVSIMPSFENSIMIHSFDSAESYGEWFAETVSMCSQEEIESKLPAKFPLESLVFILHAIDSFKRVSYKSMLDYKPVEESMIASKEYGETLKTSTDSKDIRWLLPAFSMLTPNLSKYNMKLGPDYMKLLTDSKIFIPVKKSDTGEEFFKFDEVGKGLGVEFYSSWVMSVGFETVIFNSGGTEKVLNNGFLAPTAFANNLFEIEKDAQGNGIINYSCLNFEGLGSKVENFMQKAIENSANVKADTLICANCGSDLNEDTKFCGKCGNKVQQ
ncbi:MAG: zinc ribbon domain-containing protein [Deltaproteobacteria bacterium]